MNRFIVSTLISMFCFGTVLAQQGPPTAAPAIKTFALQPDQVGVGTNSANLFTGDVTFPVNLISLPGRGGLNAGVSISYNSNVQKIVNTWNLEAPTGILGLGWSMDIPKIVADHKNTGSREDDVFYLLEGGSSNQLIRTISGSDAGGGYLLYQTKNYQFWNIKFYTSTEKWVIIKEDGTKYIYGDKASARNTVQYIVSWDNWVGNSSRIGGQSQMAIAWNISEVQNVWTERMTFEYENVDQYVGSTSGQKQTEASYIKRITDVFGRRIEFFYNIKAYPFVIEPHTERAEPDAYQESYENKYLDHIDVLPILTEPAGKILSIHLRYISK